jgi:hypothetical protein
MEMRIPQKARPFENPPTEVATQATGVRIIKANFQPVSFFTVKKNKRGIRSVI